jgi:nicotinate-nucleotide adenylyltransferase
MRNKIGVLGGTFDPIHFGHLRLALELKQSLGLSQMRLMPCHRPVHRGEPQVSSAQRAEMIRLALLDCPELTLDERELRRDTPSYTFDTLRSLRAELGAEVSLIWAMGTDAFAALDSWNRWQELLDYAHLVVIERPGFSLPDAGPVARLLQQHRAPASALDELPAGAIVLPSLRLLDISATGIRAQLAAGESAQFLLPESVRRYILAEGLYRQG